MPKKKKKEKKDGCQTTGPPPPSGGGAMLCLYRKLKDMSIGEWSERKGRQCIIITIIIFFFSYFVHGIGLVERARYQQHKFFFFFPLHASLCLSRNHTVTRV